MKKHVSARDIERFSEKYSKADGDECCIWTASRTSTGYGQISFGGRPVKAHRLAYKIANPEWDMALCVLHRCDNPLCVNPAHLFVGTVTENHADMMAKGRNGFVPRHGEESSSAKINEAQVREIREKYATGNYEHRDLAGEYNLSTTAINLIITRKTWKHIESDEDYAKRRQTYSRKGCSKITHEQVREIRNAYQKGIVTQLMLSKKYGVGPTQIARILHRQQYATI